MYLVFKGGGELIRKNDFLWVIFWRMVALMLEFRIFVL